MIHFPGRGVVLATGAAVLLHLLLFAAVQPSLSHAMEERVVPPRTRYLQKVSGEESASESKVRVVKSPVIFSLPSLMGFSRELGSNDVRTRLSFLQPVETEHFLATKTPTAARDGRLAPLELMVSSIDRGPGLPTGVFAAGQPQPAAKRVFLAPDLMDRLVGGIVLPPELNQRTETPWEVHASITVSEQGAVEHVLLDHPLETPALNQQAQRLLYSLRFKAGEPIESSIEIYSPETAGGSAP